MSFTPKTWVDGDPSTPLDAAGLVDMEERLAALADGALLGVSGREYRIVSGVLRNDGSPDYWQPIEDASHRSQNIDSVSVSGNDVKVDYASLGATRVVMLHAVPDETLAKAGVSLGASVGKTESLISFRRERTLADYLYYDEGSATWKTGLGSSPFTISGFSSGSLSVSHEDIGSTMLHCLSLTPRGHDLRPVATAAGGGHTRTSFTVQFYDADNTLVTTPSNSMRVFAERHQSGQVAAESLDTVALPNSNFWFFGVFEV